MKHRIIALVLGFVLVAAGIGCGQKSESGSNTATEASEATTPQAQAEEEAVTEAVQEPVTLHLFHQKQEAQDSFSQIIAAFNEEYPYITIEQEIVTNEPAAVLSARIATDEIPDIFQAALNTIDISKGGYMVDLSNEDFLKAVNESAVQSSSFTDSDGKTWALPLDSSCIGIIYNKDIFSQYKLEVPQTLSEFDKVVSTLRDNKIIPFALGFKDTWTIKTTSLTAFAPSVYGKYPQWSIQKNEGKVSFAQTPEWTQSFEILKKIYESGDTQTAFDTDYNGACAMIANGEAAMMAQGLWAVEAIRAINPDVNIGFMAMPVSENPSDAKLHVFPDFGLSISSSSTHIEECKLFLEFLTREDTAKLWCSTAKLFSSIKGVSVDFDPVASDVNDYINSNMVVPEADRGWPTAFHTDFEQALPNYLLGNISLDDTMKNLDQSWTSALSASE